MNERDATRPERWAARGAVLAVVAAIVVAGVRAVIDGWYPIGDNALLTLRARDVLTPHHPLLGTWTSASLSIGTPINNPGPLQFDLLAPFAKIDRAAGVALGVTAVNVFAVGLIAGFARRLGGARLVAIAMVTTGSVVWSVGSELLFDPWQPHSLLLPFLALLVLAVGIAAGDPHALPWAVGVGSYIVQTHLSYAVLVPGLIAAAMAWAALPLLRRRLAPLERQAARRQATRSVLVATAVGILCWAQPLWEQVTRDGNLEKVATSAGEGDAPVGVEAGVRIAGSVIGPPTGWLPPSFAERFAPDPLAEVVVDGPPMFGVRSLPLAVISLLAVVALLAGAAWVARHRGDRTGTAIAVVGAAAVGLAVATTAALPVSEVFGISPHQVRWLWPIAVVSAVLPFAAVLPRHRATTVAAGLLAVLAAVGTLPARNVEAGPSADAAAQPVVRELVAQMEQWPRDEVLYFDGRTVPFAEPFSGPVLLELQRLGIDFEVDEDFSYQVGPRRAGPVQATRQLRFIVGPDALNVPPGPQRLAVVDGLDEGEARRFEELSTQLRDAGDDLDLRLGPRGAEARDLGLLPALDDPGWSGNAGLLLDGGVLRTLVREDYLDTDVVPEWVFELGRLAERRDRYSVAVVLEPLAT